MKTNLLILLVWLCVGIPAIAQTSGEIPHVSEIDSAPAVEVAVEPYALPVCRGANPALNWNAPKNCGKELIDNYFSDCRSAMDSLDFFIASTAADYASSAQSVCSQDGIVYRAVKITNAAGEPCDITGLIERNIQIISAIEKFKFTFTALGLTRTNANIALPELGLKAFEYAKEIKLSAQVLERYKAVLGKIQAEKSAENELLRGLQSAGLTIDGVASSDSLVFIPAE